MVTPGIQDMYNRFRRDRLDPNKRYTLVQVKNTLEEWLNQPHKDGRTPHSHQYSSDKQLGGTAKLMSDERMLQGTIIKVRYNYINKNGKGTYAINYRNIITGKRVTKEEFMQQQEREYMSDEE